MLIAAEIETAPITIEYPVYPASPTEIAVNRQTAVMVIHIHLIMRA